MTLNNLQSEHNTFAAKSIKATRQTFYDKRFFDKYDNNKALKDYLTFKKRRELETDFDN